MADIYQVLLTLGGWIVAGVAFGFTAGVTIFGIFVKHWLEERSRRKERDRVEVFEPLRREIEAALGGKHMVEPGYIVWTPSKDFESILHRGALAPERHSGLRKDIDELMQLCRKHAATFSAFDNARVDALKTAWKTAEVRDVEMEEKGAWFDEEDVRTLADVPWMDYSDKILFESLALGDKDGWIRRFKVMIPRDHEDFPNYRVLTPAGQLYDEVWEQIKGPRDEYREAAAELLLHALNIRSGLDNAIGKESRYRWVRGKKAVGKW